MTDAIKDATRALWDAGDIVERDVTGLLGRLASPGIDTGELFFQLGESESWSLEDGTVKSGSYSVDRGVGVRAISGEKTGFAYAEDLVLRILERGFDFWESGGDYLHDRSIYDGFMQHQREQLHEMSAMADRYGWDVIDARGTIEEVFEEVRQAVMPTVESMSRP